LKLPANTAKTNLAYSTEGRGISKGRNVWFVYFNEVAGKNSVFNGCVVEVHDDVATLDSTCKR
jgi:hypothetical protein